MKNQFFTFRVTVLAPFLFLLWVAPLFALDPKIALLENKPVPEFTPPPIQTHTFKNGARLYFLKNSELPVFEMSILWAYGSIHDPWEKRGLSAFVLHGMRSGGTKEFSPQVLDETLEQVAANINVESSEEYSTVTLQTMKDDIDLGLKTVVQMLRTPAFNQERLEIVKKRLLDQISRRNEEPMDTAEREFAQQLYGDKSVWARLSNRETVSALTREDALKAHQKNMSPDRLWIAVSGDIGFDTLVGKLESHFGDWQSHKVEIAPIPQVPYEWEPVTQVIDRAINQSSLVMGYFGSRRNNPDKYALILVNQIIGGSTFGSRLGSQIRTNLGLAYSVYSRYGFGTDYGSFEIKASTKSASTISVIMETKKVLQAVRDSRPLTQDELDFAKKTILNQLIFEYENPFSIVKARRYYDFFGYPPNYLEIYQDEIKKVELEKIHQVVQKYVFPDRLIVMIVGNRKELGRVEELGEVITRPLDVE